MNQSTNTLIIGAGLAGLATAAALQKRRVPYIIIEKQDQVAAPWRSHYHRLHLHTPKSISHLPFRKFSKTVPRYPSRQQVVDYLDEYRRAFEIEPLFNTRAIKIKREGAQWLTKTDKGFFHSNNLVMATGIYEKPRPIGIKGVDTFPGTVLHSRDYTTGETFIGRRVLVVGFGNSACEIAIDLFEQGAIPSLSVRSAINIVPRDVFGIPILRLSLFLSVLPPRVADRLSGPLMRWLIGDITRLGLRRKSYGPLEEIRRDGHPPVLDIGTIRHIREGHISVHPGIDHIDGSTVCFNDGTQETFDAIVAAIGYDPGYGQLLDMGEVRLNEMRLGDARLPISRQKYFGTDGLYFCGYRVSPTGQIRSISADAQKIAKQISRGSRQDA
jgi:hypothetical protein